MFGAIHVINLKTMKSLSIVILFIFAFTYANRLNAQDHSRAKMNHTYTDEALNNLVGEWVGKNGNQTLKLYLFKDVNKYPGNIKVEVLKGYHYYEKDGQVVSSSYSSINDKSDKKKTTVLLKTPYDDKSGKVLTGSLVFEDSKTYIQLKLNLDPVSNSYKMDFHEFEGATLTQVEPNKRQNIPQKPPIPISITIKKM